MLKILYYPSLLCGLSLALVQTPPPPGTGATSPNLPIILGASVIVAIIVYAWWLVRRRQ